MNDTTQADLAALADMIAAEMIEDDAEDLAATDQDLNQTHADLTGMGLLGQDCEHHRHDICHFTADECSCPCHDFEAQFGVKRTWATPGGKTT